MKNIESHVQYVSSMLNTFDFPYGEFCEKMSREHRTLQQSFTLLCLAWISTCASDTYCTDGRNERAHEVCKALIDSFKKEYSGTSLHLPMI